MIVVRWTFHAKSHCTDELVESITSQPEYGLPEPPHGWRVYWHSPLGPWNVVTWEVEFESLPEYEAWLKEFMSAPRFGEWYDLRRNLVDRGGGGEVWNAEQFG